MRVLTRKRRQWKFRPDRAPKAASVAWDGPSMKRQPAKGGEWKKYRMATRLRRKPTASEVILKDKLKAIYGKRNVWFQPVLFGYIPDLYFPKLKLAVEVDGGYHNVPEQAAYDQRRTEHLGGRGVTVIRFSNEDVTRRMKFVVSSIDRTIEQLGSKVLRNAFNTNHCVSSTGENA